MANVSLVTGKTWADMNQAERLAHTLARGTADISQVQSSPQYEQAQQILQQSGYADQQAQQALRDEAIDRIAAGQGQVSLTDAIMAGGYENYVDYANQGGMEQASQGMLTGQPTTYGFQEVPQTDYEYNRDEVVTSTYGDTVYEPMSFPYTPETSTFNLFENPTAELTTEGQLNQLQSLMDMGVVDQNGRLLVENLSDSDLYELSTGGFGLGENALHTSLIEQAKSYGSGATVGYDDTGITPPDQFGQRDTMAGSDTMMGTMPDQFTDVSQAANVSQGDAEFAQGIEGGSGDIFTTGFEQPTELSLDPYTQYDVQDYEVGESLVTGKQWEDMDQVERLMHTIARGNAEYYNDFIGTQEFGMANLALKELYGDDREGMFQAIREEAIDRAAAFKSATDNPLSEMLANAGYNTYGDYFVGQQVNQMLTPEMLDQIPEEQRAAFTGWLKNYTGGREAADQGMLLGLNQFETMDPYSKDYLYYGRTRDLEGGETREPWEQLYARWSDADWLKKKYNGWQRQRMQTGFDSEVEYVSYMAELQDLQRRGLIPNFQKDINSADLSDLSEEDFIALYENENFQDLMGRYGITPFTSNSDGDQFVWTGNSFHEVSEVDDHMGVGDWVKVVGAAGLALVGVPALASAIGPIAGSTAASMALSGAVVNTATQLALTGDFSPEEALMAALTAGAGEAFAQSIQGTDIFDEMLGQMDDVSVGGQTFGAAAGQSYSILEKTGELTNAAREAYQRLDSLAEANFGPGAPSYTSGVGGAPSGVPTATGVAGSIGNSDLFTDTFVDILGPGVGVQMGEEFFRELVRGKNPETLADIMEVFIPSIPTGLPLPENVMVIGTLGEILSDPSIVYDNVKGKVDQVVDIFVERDANGDITGVKDMGTIVDGVGEILTGAVEEDPSIINDLPTVVKAAVLAGVFGDDIIDMVKDVFDGSQQTTPLPVVGEAQIADINEDTTKEEDPFSGDTTDSSMDVVQGGTSQVDDAVQDGTSQVDETVQGETSEAGDAFQGDTGTTTTEDVVAGDTGVGYDNENIVGGTTDSPEDVLQGGGSSGGGGGGGGGGTGEFSPFMSGITYNPLQLAALIQTPKVNPLPARASSERLNVVKSLFGDMI